MFAVNDRTRLLFADFERLLRTIRRLTATVRDHRITSLHDQEGVDSAEVPSVPVDQPEEDDGDDDDDEDEEPDAIVEPSLVIQPPQSSNAAQESESQQQMAQQSIAAYGTLDVMWSMLVC